MKKYIVHDETGKILRTGICPASMLRMQAQRGEFAIEGEANDIEHKIIDGKIIRKPQVEIDTIKDKLYPRRNPEEILIHEKIREISRRQAIKELEKERINGRNNK
jgi:hypothetical protein